MLVKHPRLRVYVMHAGYPMLDELIALMMTYPQVYVDIAELNWARPVNDFRAHVKRLVDVGLGKRIMFGSDALTPELIAIAITTIDSTTFLTDQQRQDIFCDNAARFFRIEPDPCTIDIGARPRPD